MVEMMKRDWILFKNKFLFMIPIMSISLILLYPKADEGYFIIGLPLIFILPVLLFVVDDKDKGTQQLLSLPFSRKGIAQGRFFSAWILMGVGFAYLLVLGFSLGIFYPEAFISFVGYLKLETLFLYLWFLTALVLIAFPVLFALLGKGIQALVFVGLGLNLLLGVFFMFQFQSAGPDLFEIIKGLVLSIRAYHQGFMSYTTSLLILILLNWLNLRLCQWIFMRKEF
ncbi:ABC-2 transporter permease [bacterium]|nr:ABC-2 transporter permease [bacterium]